MFRFEIVVIKLSNLLVYIQYLPSVLQTTAVVIAAALVYVMSEERSPQKKISTI